MTYMTPKPTFSILTDHARGRAADGAIGLAVEDVANAAFRPAKPPLADRTAPRATTLVTPCWAAATRHIGGMHGTAREMERNNSTRWNNCCTHRACTQTVLVQPTVSVLYLIHARECAQREEYQTALKRDS